MDTEESVSADDPMDAEEPVSTKDEDSNSKSSEIRATVFYV